jgi:hypothetical protein
MIKKMLWGMVFVGTAALISVKNSQAAGSGTSPCELSASTAVVCATGAGSYYGASLSVKAAPNDFLVCYDTATLVGGPTSNLSTGTTANPIIDTLTAVSTNTVTHGGANIVTQFNSGLTCLKNSANGVTNAIVYFKQ